MTNIRCRTSSFQLGIYYVYYNQNDSYPEELGAMIAGEVPSTNEQYESKAVFFP